MPHLWSNPSVLAFAGERDPISAIEEAARSVVLRARESGWKGPPFNPVDLAPLFRAKLRPNSSLLDARVIVENNETIIEYNPHQARERVRFSIAHELAHLLFPDYHVETRNRSHAERGYGWQLEMLCNIAASEFVLPIGSLPAALGSMSLEELMVERRAFDVSAEAFLIRVAKVSDKPITMFVASSLTDEKQSRRYTVEYSLSSPTSEQLNLRGKRIPSDSMVQHCTAIGFTQYEVSSWATGKEEHVEFVGIPGFPGERFPRVAGLIRHGESEANRSPIKYRHGSILDISYPGRRIVCQLVNDKAIRWGGGIARRMAERYPEAEEHYASKMMIIPQSARLGSVIYSPLEHDLTLASVVGQAGFGPSLFPRVRYEALERGLRDVSEFAIANAASVHLPKLGTGAAGGDWGIVEEIIDNELVRKGLDVVVYDLPPKRKQLELF